MRLTGGGNYFEGRVEICSEGEWETATVCDNSWNIPDAEVVCSQLGFFSPGKVSHNLMILLPLRSCITCQPFTNQARLHAAYVV